MGRLIAWTGKGSWYLLAAGWPLLAVYLLVVPTMVETVPLPSPRPLLLPARVWALALSRPGH